MKSIFYPAVVQSIVLLVACTQFAGCAGASCKNGAPPMHPRPSVISPTPMSTLSSNFAAARLTKLAVIVEGSPIYAASAANSANDWRANIVNGHWQSRPQASPQAANITRFVEDEFISALLRKGYTVPTRSDLQAALSELKFLDKTGYTERDAVQLGKILKASGIVIVGGLGRASNFTYKHQGYTRIDLRLSARLIGVEQAEVLWVGTKTYDGDEITDLISVLWIGNLFANLADSLPARR